MYCGKNRITSIVFFPFTILYMTRTCILFKFYQSYIYAILCPTFKMISDIVNHFISLFIPLDHLTNICHKMQHPELD